MKTRDLCMMAVFTALLSGGKYALSGIPNVEVVTSLLIVFTLAAGLRRTLLPCLCFIIVDCCIYGIGTWVPMYLGYWPLLCVLVGLTGRLKTPVRVAVSIGIGIAMTGFFGVWTTFIDCLLMGGVGAGWTAFLRFFAAKYVSGAAFYMTHVVSNCIVLPVLVPILTGLLTDLIKKTARVKPRPLTAPARADFETAAVPARQKAFAPLSGAEKSFAETASEERPRTAACAGAAERAE